MKSLTGVFVTDARSILPPVFRKRGSPRAQNCSAHRLAAAVPPPSHRERLRTSTVPGSALGMNPELATAQLYQRETTAGDDSGRLMAVTLLAQTDDTGQFRWWTKTEIRATCTSVTRTERLSDEPRNVAGSRCQRAAAQTGFATEKTTGSMAASPAPRPDPPSRPAQ